MDKNRLNTFGVLGQFEPRDDEEEQTRPAFPSHEAKEKKPKKEPVGHPESVKTDASKSKTDREGPKSKGVPAEPHPKDRQSGQAYQSHVKRQGHGAYNEGDPIRDHTKEYLNKEEEEGRRGKPHFGEKKEEEKQEPPKKTYKDLLEEMKPHAPVQTKAIDPEELKKKKFKDEGEGQKKKTGAMPVYHVAMNTENADLLAFNTEKPRFQQGERRGPRGGKRNEEPQGEHTQPEKVEGQQQPEQPSPTGGEPHQEEGEHGGQRRGGFRGGRRGGGQGGHVQYVAKGENGGHEEGHHEEGEQQEHRGGWRGGRGRGGGGRRGRGGRGGRGGPREGPREGGYGQERQEGGEFHERRTGGFRGGRGGRGGYRKEHEGGPREGGERPEHHEHHEHQEGGEFQERRTGGFRGGRGGRGGYRKEHEGGQREYHEGGARPHTHHGGGRGGQGPSFRVQESDFPSL